jgi:alpha-acetolactate decarboxylase
MAERVAHTLYQVSTATALIEGIYQGAVQVADSWRVHRRPVT